MKHENQHFTEATIELDDNEYVGCTFSRCTFRYGGSFFMLTSCGYEEVRFSLHGAAARTLVFLRFVRALPDGEALCAQLLAAPLDRSPPPAGSPRN